MGRKTCGHIILAFHFGPISTQRNCSGARDHSKQTHSKTKACAPFSLQPDTQGHKQILNWPNLLSQSLWTRPLQLYLSTLTATLWLDGLKASRLQHRCSCPPVLDPLSKLASCYCTLGSPFTVTVTKAENFPTCHTAFFLMPPADSGTTLLLV